MRIPHVVLAFALFIGATVLAQAPAFEVASIKTNRSGDAHGSIAYQAGGLFSATNVPLAQLLDAAYQVQTFQIVDAPVWTNADRFDIAAKAPSSTGAVPANLRSPSTIAMLRALLAQRFKLSVHQEVRERPIYVLAVTAPNGTLGPQLQRTAESDCNQRTPCPSLQFKADGLVGHGVPLTELIDPLIQIMNRPVVDHTALTGRFDFTLEWTPEPLTATDQPSASLGASIFTAVKEQMGLTLESGRGPVDVLVIDHIERPTEN